MISVSSQRGEVEAYVVELVANTLEEVAELQNQDNGYAAGSSCICLEDTSVWMLGGDKVWYKL